ncbi:MAG: FIST C-terminal domain-containing protein [Deltaproteobacteria bacterium]|nr:FIST C-terminal domain-containing protein [Deltaproteobacteria bacterium]
MAAIAVGRSGNRRALDAGREAAREAVGAMDGERVRGVVTFATAAHDQRQLLRGIREITGDAPLSGCSTSGILTAQGSDESTHAVAVMTVGAPLTFEGFLVEGLSRDPRGRGRELAGQVGEHDAGRGRLLLLFPDGLTGNITDLLSGVESGLRRPLTVAGGSSGELLKLGRTWQYHDDVATTDAVSAALLGGAFTSEVAVSQGCEPIGLEQTVTRAEDGWVFEIDGRSAWSVYEQYLEVEDTIAVSMREFCYLCIAERLPEPDPTYGEYIVRCPLQLDRATGAMFFPGNIRTGTKVRLALRSEARTVEKLLESARSIVARRPGLRPELLLHFDCCCRARLLFGGRTNEAAIEPVRAIFGHDVPYMGFSTYGEIAPLRAGGPTRFHNYGAVLCALYAEGAS